MQVDRRDFLRKSAIGAGLLALGAGLGYSSSYAQAPGLAGGTRTVITDTEIAARVIGGVRIATEFIPDPVPAGTNVDPYPGSAIQAALNDGLAVYVPSGTWKLTVPISRSVDNVTIIGAGKSAKLVLDGVTPCISAGSQNGWHIASLATDAGGVDISSATQSRVTEVWVAGILTDNRPISQGGGGGGGYYGVRAEDYITTGDGSASNPWNASAIQSAIDALPAQGGLVFIKAGVWRGATAGYRLRLPRSATGSSEKHVVLVGEGVHRSEYGIIGGGGTVEYGTAIEAGIDMYSPCDIYDLAIAPHPSNWKLTPCLKIIIDPTQVPNQNVWVGGFTLKRLMLNRGSYGIHFTGQKLLGIVWQCWNVVWEQLAIIQCAGGIKIEKGDSDQTAGFRGRFTDFMFHGITGASSAGAARCFDYTINSTQMTIEHWLVENSGQSPAADYAIYIDTYGDGGGVEVRNVDFGDDSGGSKDAYLNIKRMGRVIGLHHRRDIDVGGRGYFLISSRAIGANPTPTFNVLAGSGHLTIEQNPGESFALGTMSGDATKVVIRPNSPPGLLGSSTAGASPHTYTNNDMHEEYVYLVGGTITDITRDGSSVGTDRSHYLRPGDSIIITHTAAPTIRRYGVSIR